MAKYSEAEIMARAREIVQREAQAVGALQDQLDKGLVEVVDLLLNCRGHVLVTGAGTSRAVALRMAHLLACCGTPALFISAADCLHGGAGAVTENDVVYVISKGGESAETNKFAEIARARGARIVSQTEEPRSALGRMSDAVFKVRTVGDVDPYGMVATGSSLVNGAAADAICAALNAASSSCARACAIPSRAASR